MGDGGVMGDAGDAGVVSDGGDGGVLGDGGVDLFPTVKFCTIWSHGGIWCQVVMTTPVQSHDP